MGIRLAVKCPDGRLCRPSAQVLSTKAGIHGYSMREIASHLGCRLTTVHRRIRSQEGLRVGGTDA